MLITYFHTWYLYRQRIGCYCFLSEESLLFMGWWHLFVLVHCALTLISMPYLYRNGDKWKCSLGIHLEPEYHISRPSEQSLRFTLTTISIWDSVFSGWTIQCAIVVFVASVTFDAFIGRLYLSLLLTTAPDLLITSLEYYNSLLHNISVRYH